MAILLHLSDHLLQFAILEGIFKEVLPKKINLYERNFKHFNETEFDEALKNCDWDSLLAHDQNDPNLSMENLYNNTIFLLDEFVPYRKLSKQDYKLKSKHVKGINFCINIQMLKNKAGRQTYLKIIKVCKTQ